PANGFYEWQQRNGRKQPFYVTLKDGSLFAMAGLYDEFVAPSGEPVASYTIITTAPNRLVATLHDRMPAILLPSDEDEWLSPEVTDRHQVERLLQPFPAELMVMWPVSPAVNNTRHDDPSLIEPVNGPVDVSSLG
ncbi:MAG: hypothetical protein C4345_07375, partial [Chloroflexota bacterium]